MSSIFRYQTFAAISGNVGGKVPVVDNISPSHEQEIYPTNSFDENCIQFEFQTDRSYYVELRETDVLGFETETCQESCLRNLQYQRSTKGAQRGSKSGRETDARREGSSSSRCSCKIQFAFIFLPMLKTSSTISIFTTLMDCMRASLTLLTTSRGLSLSTREFALRGVWLWRISWWNYGSAFVWTFFHNENENA